MKLTLAVLSVVLLVGVNATSFELNPLILRCSEGSSFWCSSKRNAQLCGMTAHCNREWKQSVKTVPAGQMNVMVPVSDSAYCQTCLSIANNLKHFIDTGIPKQALDKKVKSVCHHNMQNTVDPENCIHNLDLLVSDIFENFEAQSVCDNLDLCQSEPADVVEINDIDAFKLHDKIKSVLMSIEAIDTVPKDDCQECIKTVTDAEKQLPNQYSLEEFTELLQEQCEEVDDSKKKPCMAWCVKLAKMIYDGTDPKAVCKWLRKC